MGYDFGVGREAPSFTLAAHDGNDIPLRQYRGDWFVVLVFYADGLEGASENVRALSNAGDLWGYRAQVLAIVHGSVQGAKDLAAEAGKVGFPILADEDGAVARAYGAWTTRRDEARNLAMIVDRAGKIVWSEGGPTPLRPAAIVAGLRAVAR